MHWDFRGTFEGTRRSDQHTPRAPLTKVGMSGWQQRNPLKFPIGFVHTHGTPFPYVLLRLEGVVLADFPPAGSFKSQPLVTPDILCGWPKTLGPQEPCAVLNTGLGNLRHFYD